jgi:putative flippase GtrA
MQLQNFIICGLLSASIYYIILFIGIELFEYSNYYLVTFAYIISSSFNFFYNKKITFKSNNNINKEIFKYILILFLSYFFNILIIFTVIEVLNFNMYSGSAVAIGTLAILRYICSKYFIYK